MSRQASCSSALRADVQCTVQNGMDQIQILGRKYKEVTVWSGISV